jgi:hypothetical protein
MRVPEEGEEEEENLEETSHRNCLQKTFSQWLTFPFPFVHHQP